MGGPSFGTPKPIFKGVIMAAAGPLPSNNTIDDFKHWAKLRKGTFTETFDDAVTHLLCSDEQLAERGPIVRTALKSKCHILRYEWFLIAMTGKEARLPKDAYDLRQIYNKEKQAERDLARLEKGLRLAERFINTSTYSPHFSRAAIPQTRPDLQYLQLTRLDLYHVYRDAVGFAYKVALSRTTPDAAEKYTLCLYESKAKPHLYWFGAKFLKCKGARPVYYRKTAHCTPLSEQMRAFGHFFKDKTGIDWEERLIRQGTMPAEYFQYTHKGGQVAGLHRLFSPSYCWELNRALRGVSPEEGAQEVERGAMEGNPAGQESGNEDERVGESSEVEMEVDFADGWNCERLASGDTPLTQLTSGDEGADVGDDERMDCGGVDGQCDERADDACEGGRSMAEMVGHEA